MISEIPIDRNAPDQKFSIDLEGTVYVFRVMWNSRTGRWTLSIFEEDETPIVMGITVVGEFDLLSQYADARLPRGTLFTADVTGKNREPTDDNFGDSVLLLYADEAQSIAAEAAVDEEFSDV